ncbi:hypothetical protein AWENTII_009084 [Aspergillus wentii]
MPSASTAERQDFNSSDPLMGFESSTSEFDFLWNNSADVNGFLPSTLFDTDHSLSDLWQTDLFRNDSTPTLSSFSETPQQTSTVRPPPDFFPLSCRLPPLEPDSLSSNTSRLPLNELNSDKSRPDRSDSAFVIPWNISPSTYEIICNAIRMHAGILPMTFTIPSRHTISRYIEGYFRGFHEHFPFLHPPTFRIDTVAPELLLSMAAMGALYRFEHTKGYELYFTSKAIVLHLLQQRSGVAAHNLMNRNISPRSDSPKQPLSPAEIQTMQALLILVDMATGSGEPLSQDSLPLGGQLAVLTRQGGLGVYDEIETDAEWKDWVRREERRRTMFFAYILLNIQSIAFDIPPLIMNREIGLCLPHCNVEWVTTTETEWRHMRNKYGHTEQQFYPTLNKILQGKDVYTAEPLSSLGNYALINALIQRIFFERQISDGPDLQSDKVKVLEIALQAWQRSWEATFESSLDPSSPKGPLGFNSAALLRLAYLRLNANLGPSRNLSSLNPQDISAAFTQNSAIFTRSSHVDRAVLQCIHALSIPIRVGIPFVASTQTMNGSIPHPLCTLECAFLLSRWLGSISDTIQSSPAGLDSLREDERKLLGMIISLIRETDRAGSLERNEHDSFCIQRMAATTVRLWAETFRGVHVFPIVSIVGQSLSTIADILEGQLGVIA